MDEFRKEVSRITQEELLKEPAYYSWICACTGLKKAQDVQSLFFLTMYFVSLFVLWNWDHYFGATSTLSPSYLTVFVFNVYLSFIGATITHNTMHTSMFRSAFKNRIIQMLLSLTYGHPVSSYVPGHNLSHHKYTQSNQDIMNTYLVTSPYHALNFLFFQQQVVLNAIKSDIRYVLFQKEMGRFYFVTQVLKEFAVILGVQIVLLYIDPWKFLLFFYVPHLFGQWAIVTMNLLQHDGCDEFLRGDKYINFNTARNFTDPLLNFVVMNNGYHTIHHLVPTSHWSVNPTLHQKLIVGKVDPRLDWTSKLKYIAVSYFLNSNPWNSDPVRRDFKGDVVNMNRKLDETKLSSPDYRYEEWMSFPADFDRSKIQTEKVALLSAFFLMFFKFMLSPVYCIDPKLKLI
jgi:fatty acid desaturase